MKKSWLLAILAILVMVFASSCSDQGGDHLEKSDRNQQENNAANNPATKSAPLTVSKTGKVEPGVSFSLADQRAINLSEIFYILDFKIPKEKDQPILGNVTINFQLKQNDDDLQIDFREAAENLKSLKVNEETVPLRHENEHLIVPASSLRSGDNQVEIEFVAGDISLNRNPDYLYTLFVPDRARSAFPVFDQPNLKARYQLTLDVPASWRAVANAPLKNKEQKDERHIYHFGQSDLMSSYLFSFVAGDFEVVTRKVNGREMNFLHRENDPEKIARNIDDIFTLHGASLSWLEEYTGIKYPFQKFDFVAIPTFQYNGMEHVGAIQYRATSLFLPENPSQTQLLSRANLIAHETAHMWFGDLVTMNWFNDVWTKEVFANFMAAKIVNPNFPDIDHNLNFLLRSYPAAYSVDRTKGANPIRQELTNLNQAGVLYGAIIYNKAPIMMRQLEILLGEDLFQEGISEYLRNYAFNNATWPDLITILDKKTDKDLRAWSEVWVNTSGRPEFRFDKDKNGGLNLRQFDKDVKGDEQPRHWPQQFSIAQRNQPKQSMDITFVDPAFQLSRLVEGSNENDLIVNADGAGYGLFPVSLNVLKKQWAELSDLQKGAQFVNVYEQMLEGGEAITPVEYAGLLVSLIEKEPNELLLNTMFGQLRRIYWSFLNDEQKQTLAPAFENYLWQSVLDETRPASTRKIFLQNLQNITMQPEMLVHLDEFLSNILIIEDITYSQRERSNLASTLAIKIPERSEVIIEKHLASITNDDEKRRFEFLIPSLSSDENIRDDFFASLTKEENRQIESWVLAALDNLHHPLRVTHSKKYILPSLELMEEIQRTGDIFFPTGWAARSLQNHSDPAVAKIVAQFLESRPDYNYQLQLKILQGADFLYRAENLLAR